MKSIIKTFFFEAMLLLAINSSYGAAIDGAVVSGNPIKDSHGFSIQWQSPDSNNYKLWVKIPDDSTATAITYHIYPKGAANIQSNCVSGDINYPCFAITINQAINQKKWLQLTINNNSKSAWAFTDKGFVSVSGAAHTVLMSFEEAYPLTIGTHYQGGIIFYLDSTKKHGLIASLKDLSDSAGNNAIAWYNGAFTTTNANAVTTGKENTTTIVAVQGIGDYAAKLCDDLILGNYDDWYLPSRDELDLMYRNIGQGASAPKTNVGNFATSIYWSSSEVDNYSAWGQNFETGEQFNYYEGNSLLVRAVRAF